MFFIGLHADTNPARIESVVIAMQGPEQWNLLARRESAVSSSAALALFQSGEPVQAETLQQANHELGEWFGAEALAVLAQAGISPQAVELAGCRTFLYQNALPVGDLAAAAQASGIPLVPVAAAQDAQQCALAAWKLWCRSRQVLPSSLQPQSITEGRNPATLEIDRLPTLDALRLINQEDARVARAVASQLPQIAEAVDRIAERMKQGGRLIYAGAGTSGRIGVLDASEIPPTYGASPSLVVGLIAGGESAIRSSLEDVEDDISAGADSVTGINIGPLDTLIGIAASGRTPFVIGALRAARQRGALTISLACVSPSPLEELADIVIAPLVGPEVITGSTRMKAGTAQKLTLNMISTLVMVRLGKTFSNLMVDMQASNFKLRQRARRIVAQACEISEAAAEEILAASADEVKTAIVATLAGITPLEARVRLANSSGVVRAALGQMEA